MHDGLAADFLVIVYCNSDAAAASGRFLGLSTVLVILISDVGHGRQVVSRRKLYGLEHSNSGQKISIRFDSAI